MVISRIFYGKSVATGSRSVHLKYILILFLVLFAFPLFAESPHSIHWKKIESASGYTVEIRNEANKSNFINTTEPTVTTMLSVGKYTYRIGIYNKLKRIAKWSDWYELEVRPLRPPIVTEQVSDFEKDGNRQKLTFSGENIFEGTNAYVIQDGKKIPAEVTTSRDRKTSVVSVDANKVDVTKDYKVVLVNPNFESIEVPLIEKEGTSDTTVATPNVKSSSRSSSLWPLLWRQALFPGWGHYYKGDHTVAYTYFTLFGASTLYTAHEYNQYFSLNDDLKSFRDTTTLVRALDPDGIAFPFFAGTVFENGLSQELAKQGQSVNRALSLVGAVYVSSIIHIIYSGLSKTTETTGKQTFQLQIGPDLNPSSHGRKIDMSQSRVDVNFNFYF